MLDCKKNSQLVSQSLDRALTLRERFGLKLHLILCRYCRRFSQQLESIRVSMKSMVDFAENDDGVKMPLKAKKRIAELVEASPPQS